jgi:hypothetical protein
MVFISHIFSGLGGRHYLSPHHPTAPTSRTGHIVRRPGSIFWYWFIASFVAVYVFLLLFVLEEEEG